MLIAKGRTGIISVDDTFITIERKGAMAKAMHGFTQGQKRIPIAQVTSVQFKKSGMSVGYIQFSMGGANESTKGVVNAMNDENSVAFGKNTEDFETIRDFIEAKITERYTAQVPAPPSSPEARSVGEQLRELAALRDEGLLSDEEFAAQKAKLLG